MILFTRTGMGADNWLLVTLVADGGWFCFHAVALGHSRLWVQMQVIWTAIWIWTEDTVVGCDVCWAVRCWVATLR